MFDKIKRQLRNIARGSSSRRHRYYGGSSSNRRHRYFGGSSSRGHKYNPLSGSKRYKRRSWGSSS
ncbi:hypothetical protein E1I69_16500 [Bacillus timonensis]|uniref:Uncharacterized protein n=1 Tax=Bacillus timonensis TaxID=1033734 RepID=A0A4S3PNI5_9BACI|nr:hypothetical protein [Bacillus timonensis]THE11008.1 hypothetical protein E1I69_16500 [Bacillus timonensis]